MQVAGQHFLESAPIVSRPNLWLNIVFINAPYVGRPEIIEALILYDYMVFVIVVEIARQIDDPVLGVRPFFIGFPHGLVGELFPKKKRLEGLAHLKLYWNGFGIIPVTYVMLLDDVFVLHLSGLIHLRYQNVILSHPFRINAIVGLQGQRLFFLANYRIVRMEFHGNQEILAG